MGVSTALKKEFSLKKLSTPQTVPVDRAQFDREALVRELLSLGTETITPEIAQSLGAEVQAELQRRSSTHWSAEMISEIVQFKLEELGVIEIRRRRQNPPGFHHPPRAPRNFFNAEETTDLLTAEQLGVPPEEVAKPFSPGSLRCPPGLALRPLPPKATLQLSERSLASLEKLLPMVAPAHRFKELEERLERIAHAAAGVERRYPSNKDSETLGVEFYNSMANLEFLPHLPSLLEAGSEAASGAHWVRVALPHGAKSQARALDLCHEIWKRGASAWLDLDSASARDPYNLESFARLLEAIERAILDLPESAETPRVVGFKLAADHPEARALFQLALSGKYYPKFHFHFGLGSSSLSTQPELFEEICNAAWKGSESSLALSGNSEPCFEAPPPSGGPLLGPLETSSLGSLNLSIVASSRDVDWLKLRRMVKSAVHLLENLLDVLDYPSEEVAKATLAVRKLGLGVMGFAELLIKLGIPYDSPDAPILGEKLMRFIHQEAETASAELAELRGVFPDYHASTWRLKGIRLRNSSLTAVVAAPSLAALADVSTGINPLAFVVDRNPALGRSFEEAMPRPLPLLEQISLKHGVWSRDLERDVMEKGSVRGSMISPKPLRRLFATQAEVGNDWLCRIQGAFQRHCDGVVGQPIQLPPADFSGAQALIETALEFGARLLNLLPSPVPLNEEVANLESIASESEFVEASPSAPPEEETAAILVDEAPASPVEEAMPPPAPAVLPQPRPEVLNASIRSIQTGCGPMTVSFAKSQDKPFEILARVGKSGGCASAQNEAISRLINLLLQVGVDSRLVYREIRGIRCPAPANDQGQAVLSCSDAISKIFERELGYLKAAENPVIHEETPEIPQRLFDDEEEITAVVAADALH